MTCLPPLFLLRLLRAASIAAAIVLSFAAPMAAEDNGAAASNGRSDVQGSIIGREEPAYERGTHLLRTGDVDAAVAELARANQIAPDDPRVLARYAQALIVSGDADGAIAALERLREIDPDAPGLDYFLGLASYQGGNWSAARDHFSNAVADSPDSALTYLFLGVAHYELGEYNEAGQALDHAERLDPSLAGQVSYRRGLLHYAESRFAEAKREFEYVQTRRPGSPLARSATSYIARLNRLHPRPWDVYATFGGGYDSNLNFSADSDTFAASGISSGRIIAEAGGSYRFGDQRRHLTIGQTLYGHFYPDDTPRAIGLAPDDFNQQISRTWAQASAEIAGPVSVDARYTFEYVWTDWKQFRQTHAVEPGLSFALGPRLGSRAFFRWEGRTYFFGFTSPGFDRDGDVTHAGGDLSYVLPSDWFWGTSFARVGYRMRREDAVGFEFDAYGHQPVFTLSLALPRAVVLTLDGRVEWRDYDNASSLDPSAGTRDDLIGELHAIFQRPFGDHVSAELTYSYTDRNSNVAAFEYQRHVLSVLATYQY